MDTQTALPDRFRYLPGFQIMPYLRLRQVAMPDNPLELVKGGRLDHVEVAYETYGSLSPEKGLERLSKTHKEIYLSDFNKTKPENLKTILRVKTQKR